MVKTTKKNLKKAFTITELVIVIAVIAILAAVLIPTLSGVVGKANESVAMQEARSEWTNYYAEIAADGEYEATDTYFVIHYDDGTPDYYYTVTAGQFNTTSNEYVATKCQVGSLVVTTDSTKAINGVYASESGCVDIYRVYATAAAEAAADTGSSLASGKTYYAKVVYSAAENTATYTTTCWVSGTAISTTNISVKASYETEPSYNSEGIGTTAGDGYDSYTVTLYAASN